MVAVMTISHPPVVKIQQHCDVLGKLLFALSFSKPVAILKDGETIGWDQPAQWLELAASIVNVDVLTGQSDTSLYMCESALDYENDRSALLTQFVTSLTIFTYVWGAFESVAKIMSPPSIPKHLRREGNDSLTARVVYALASVQTDGVYFCALANLRYRLLRHQEYNSCIPSNLGPVANATAGEGIDLVRVIRNKFAHGAASLPQRDDWIGEDSLDNQLVRFSCRIVLLTIQAMLRVLYQNNSFVIEMYGYRSALDLDEESESETDMYEIHSLLETIHLATDADSAKTSD
jgi:hypothetical protein